MPRNVRITLPAPRTEQVLARIRSLEGLMGLRLERGVSLEPPGDVLDAEVTVRAAPELLLMLDEEGIGSQPGSSISTNEPVTVISASSSEAILGDENESPWEEMQVEISRESRMTANGVLLMALSGVLAAVGIAAEALHIVIAAMILAPGFEPVARIPLALVARTSDWRNGVRDTLRGYAALVAGALAAQLLFVATGLAQPGPDAYLQPGALVTHWTTLTPAAAITSFAAGLAGAIVIAAHRSVLTAGAMIGLALVPAAALIGMGIGAREAAMTGQGALRLALEFALVAISALVIFGWKRLGSQKRNSMLGRRPG